MMMKILESAIEHEVVRRAWRELNVRSLKLNVVGQTGWPDRLFLIPGGRPLFIEFKRPGGILSKRQIHVQTRLNLDGYKVEIYDNADRAFQVIEQAVATACLSKEGR